MKYASSRFPNDASGRALPPIVDGGAHEELPTGGPEMPQERHGLRALSFAVPQAGQNDPRPVETGAPRLRAATSGVKIGATTLGPKLGSTRSGGGVGAIASTLGVAVGVSDRTGDGGTDSAAFIVDFRPLGRGVIFGALGGGATKSLATAAPHIVQNRSPAVTACPLGHTNMAACPQLGQAARMLLNSCPAAQRLMGSPFEKRWRSSDAP